MASTTAFFTAAASFGPLPKDRVVTITISWAMAHGNKIMNSDWAISHLRNAKPAFVENTLETFLFLVKAALS
jgi:hypothetical protein